MNTLDNEGIMNRMKARYGTKISKGKCAGSDYVKESKIIKRVAKEFELIKSDAIYDFKHKIKHKNIQKAFDIMENEGIIAMIESINSPSNKKLREVTEQLKEYYS